MRTARARQAGSRVRSFFLGALCGFAAAVLATLATLHVFAWRPFLLEAALGGLAGLLLAGLCGGALKGALLFPAAYLAALFLREAGLDPTVHVFGGAPEIVLESQGHLIATGLLLACGVFLGNATES